METKKNNIYLKPQQLLDEYYKSIDKGSCTDLMILYFYKIAKNFAKTFEYINKSDMDACVNYAVFEAWQRWYEYKPEKSDNIFAFYTTLISNEMRTHYKQITRGKSLQISIESLFENKDR